MRSVNFIGKRQKKSSAKFAAESAGEDSYQDAVIKYVPAEVLTVYLAAKGILDTASEQVDPYTPWIVYVLGHLFVIVHLRLIARVRELSHILLSSVAFFLWVLQVGGPPSGLGIPAYIEALLLVGFTFAAPYVGLLLKKT